METRKGAEPEAQGEGARRPYERPRIRWEEDFLPYAYSSCGKMSGGGCGVAMLQS